MLSLLSAFCASSVPRKYANLVRKAVENSKKRTAMSGSDEMMTVGDYSFGGISFHLTRNLINPNVPQIAGYAREDNVIALIKSRSALSDNFDEKTSFFADPESQKIFDLGAVVASDKKVELFEASEVNPLTVFSNLLMKTVPEVGYDCTVNETAFTGARCKAWFSYNWPKPKENEDPLKLKPIGHNVTGTGGQLEYRVGAYGQAVGQVAVKFSGLFDVTADFAVDIDAVGGLGLLFHEKVFDFSKKIYDFNYPIFGYSVKVLGIKLAFGVEAYVGFALNHITLDLPEIDYYRDFVFNFHKSGKLSTKSGYHGDPFSYDIHSDTTSNIENISIDTIIEKIKFGIQPTIDLGIRAVVEVGSLLKTNLEIGSDFKLDVQLGLSRTLCTFPYIHGSTQFGIDFYIRSMGIRILELNLVKGFDLTWPIYNSRRSPDVCFFSPYKSHEGLISLTSDSRIPSVVIKPTGAYPPKDHLTDNNPKFSVRLEAYPGSDGSTPYRTLQLQTMKFPKYVGGEQYTVPLSRILVLTNPRESTVMKYSAVEKDPVFDDFFQLQKEFTITKDMNESICGYKRAATIFNEDDGICVKTEVFRSQTVEEFKEFEANSSYISLKPSHAINGDIFGLITHGDNETYKATLDKYDALDDASLDVKDSKKGEYHFKRFLNITLNKFKYQTGKQGKSYKSSMWFNRCVSGVCTEIGHLFLPSTQPYVWNNAEKLYVSEFAVPFDLSGDNYDLKVTFDLNDDSKDLKEFVFSRDELNFDGEFDRPKSIDNNKFQLTLHFENIAPTILFEVNREQAKNQNYKGIVSRVFQPTSVWTQKPVSHTFSMRVNESYGILRYFFQHDNKKVASQTSFSTIIKAKDIVPLCNHQFLDEDHILINLVYGDTLLSTDDQTHYFDNAFSINIPFRRKNSTAITYTFEMVSVFISEGNGICSLTNVISGTIRSGLFTGCIDTISENSTKTWTTLFSGISDSNFEQFSYDTNDWALISYKAKNPEFARFEMRLRYGNFGIDANSSSLFVDGLRASEFRNSSRTIDITCERCDSVRVETMKSQTYLQRVNNKFIYSPTTDDDLLFVAQCNDSYNQFCEFQEDFANDGLCLVEFQSTDGVTDLNFGSEGIRLEDGVSRQLIYGRNISKLMKTWVGKIVKIATNILANNLVVVVNPLKNGTFEITAKFGELTIPLSIRLFRQDPTAFLQLIAIQQPPGGFVDGDIMFTANGTIVVRGSLIGNLINKYTNKAPASESDDISMLVDIPPSYIRSASIQCSDSSHLENGVCIANSSKQGSVAVIISVTATVLCILIGVPLFAYFYKKRQIREDQEVLTAELTGALKIATEP